MEFPEFLVSPLDDLFRALKIAMASRLSESLLPIIPGAISVVVTYKPQDGFQEPAPILFPLVVDFRDRDGSEILASFPKSVQPQAVVRMREIVEDFLRDPYSISLLTSGRRVDLRVCKMPTDWLRKLLPRMAHTIDLGGDSTTGRPARFRFAVRPTREHGEWHLLCDMREFASSERLEIDKYPELASVASAYNTLLERVLSSACRLFSRGALVDPRKDVARDWRLVKTAFPGVYAAGWSHMALTRAYGGTLGLLMHIADSNQSPQIHIECSQNAVVRTFVAAAVVRITRKPPLFRGRFVIVSASTYGQLSEIFSAISMFRVVASGSVEIFRSQDPVGAEERANLSASLGNAQRSGPILYIDMDIPESPFVVSTVVDGTALADIELPLLHA